MKQPCFFVCTFLCFFLQGALKAQEVPYQHEQEAIRRVVDDETLYFYSRDYQKWASCWSHQPDVYFSATSREGYTIRKGWKAVSENMKLYFRNNPDPHHPPIERDNFAYHIQDDLAWVYYDNREGDAYGKQQRVLRKENGQWKIINMTTIDEGSYLELGNFRRLLRFSFRPEAEPRQIARIQKLYQRLAGKVDGVVSSVWMMVPEAKAPFSHALLLEFTSEEAMRAFEIHADQSRIAHLCEPIMISQESDEYRLD